VRILVTGATGYLGRALVAACRESGHDTLAFSRHATRAGLPGDVVDGDVRDLSSVRAAAAGCDAICHAAALVSVWRSRAQDFDDVNVGGLRNVLQAAGEARIARVAYTSSFLALPPAGSNAPGLWNDYQRTKVLAAREAERAVAEGIPLVRLFPGVLFGPGVMSDGNLVGRMLSDHLAGRLPGLVGASRTWSFAWVEDVAAAHVAALERGRPGACYCLGGENLPQRALFEVLRRKTGRRLPLAIPPSLAVPVAAWQEWRAARTGRPPQLTVGTVEILERDWPLDSGPAIAELGYHVTPLARGVERIIDELLAAAPDRREEGA